ncbi:MAG TPA: hypothetical protein VGI16_13825 [Candidatus Acidoferrum sp.]
MNIRGTTTSPRRPRSDFYFPPASAGVLTLGLALVLFLASCGAPGEPTPPSPPIPTAITDLAAKQAGDGVQLTFSLPTKTIKGDRLAESPSIEVLRGTLKPDGAFDEKSFAIVFNVPGSLIENYRAEGHVQIVVPAAPDEVRAHPGYITAFRVRTRLSRKRASSDSNTATAALFPVAEKIAAVETHVTETSIDLAWPAPTKTSAGDPLASISEYHVYRGELDPSSIDAASKDLSQAKWKSPLTLLSASPTNNFTDINFDFGKTYLYTVRTVTQPAAAPLESADSQPAIVTPKDIFPPAPPQDATAAVLAPPNAAPEVDLSWSINTEQDFAGYRVYRSEQQGTPGKLLTNDLLPSPSYRDTSIKPGHRYWYSVTAVDRAGNESAASAPVLADITQPSS